MKNLLFLSFFALALIFSSCGSEQSGKETSEETKQEAVVEKTAEAQLADDVCKMMDKFTSDIDTPEEQESFLNEVFPFMKRFDELEKTGVTQGQYMKAMRKICPEKAERFAKAMDSMEN